MELVHVHDKKEVKNVSIFINKNNYVNYVHSIFLNLSLQTPVIDTLLWIEYKLKR
ncbi:hypothetical protein FLACOL7796_03081 [Flavobacterium collinsii]|uniref:Uncharacterized protein n=1 Tax=Flavobacterium collinsii TaxID=1114861 RepID=A0ABM8KKY8_9FLAO|nr:hypothetical protein FLACOL7796_03081 [Flavobacterium collinsii]